jgi:hypothetical protein
VASGFWKSGEQDFENQGISRASVLNERIIADALIDHREGMKSRHRDWNTFLPST